MLAGESVDSLSRELGVEPYRLERWRDKALSGMESGLKEREGDPVSNELDRASEALTDVSKNNHTWHPLPDLLLSTAAARLWFSHV
jgi:transposase-like protein